jgi:nitrile hydratase
MNGPHDMGGRHGFGAVPTPAADDRPWHHDFERRMHVMALASQVRGFFVLDEQRHACEQLPPAMYIHCNYYERWYSAVSGLLVSKGVLSLVALDARVADFMAGTAQPTPQAPAADLGPTLVGAIHSGASAMREPPGPPKYAAGDEVVTLNLNVPTHHRLPSYAKAKRGTVTALPGAFTLNDSLAHGGGEAPTRVYTVAFTADELWGDAAESPGDLVYLDLFETYLLPAEQGAS